MAERMKVVNTLRAGPAGLVTGISQKLNELETAVTNQADRFAAVLEISAALASTRDVEQLLKLVIDRIAGLLGAEAATVFMVDEEKKELWSRVMRGSSLKEIRIPITKGIAGSVVASGKTILLEDAYEDARFNSDVDRRSGFRTRSLIAAPLRHSNGKILGVIEVLHRKVNAFSPEDISLVEAVAAQIAAVLDNVLLYDRLRQQNAELVQAKDELSEAVQDLDLLYKIEKASSSAEREEDLLNEILENTIKVVGSSAGSILLINEDQGALYFRSARGERSESLISMSLKADQGIAGYVATTGETINVADAADSPHYDPSVAKKLGVQIKALLAVPIYGKDGILGALELLNKPQGFTASDERLVTLLAGQAGRAIQMRKEREEGQREERLAAIGQMLSSVLHDLRTPMTIIGGYAELMALEDAQEERRKLAEVINKQFDHINAMTKETLAFARGERELLLSKVYMQEFVKEVESYLRKDFERTGVELKIHANYTGTVRVDVNKLKRVVYNIARNAVQAMPNGGRFVFTVDREGEDLMLRFQDNGPGIPQDIADKLFQSFVTSGKKNGTGLGLAIVKRIAEEHGGGVTFKSKPGKGTTFEVRVPARMPLN